MVHKVTSKSREGGLSQGKTVKFTDCRGPLFAMQLTPVQFLAVLQVYETECISVAMFSIELHMQSAGFRGTYTASNSH